MERYMKWLRERQPWCSIFWLVEGGGGGGMERYMKGLRERQPWCSMFWLVEGGGEGWRDI